LAFPDAGWSMQDHDVVSLRVTKALGDPVEQVVAAEKRQVAARNDIALEPPERRSLNASRNLQIDGFGRDASLQPYRRCSGRARIRCCQGFPGERPTLIGPVLKVPATCALSMRTPVPSVTDILPSLTSSASRRPRSRPTGPCCFSAAIS